MADGTRVGPGIPEQPPALALDARLRTAAGTPVAGQLHITNRAGEPRVMHVSVLGVDASWLPRPTRSAPVPPGVTVTADLTLLPAVGTVPARYPLSVAVEALDPESGRPTTATQIVDLELLVDAPGQIDIQVEPTEAHVVFRRKITITVRNTGLDAAPVALEAQASGSVELSVPGEDVVVPPGRTVRVRGRVKTSPPRLFGSIHRFPFTVTARSYGAPRYVEGSIAARPLLGSVLAKVLVFTAIIATWVALAFVYIPKLSHLVRNDTANSAVQTPAASGSAGTGGTGSGKGGSGGGGSGTGQSGNGGGSGAGGSGSGGSTGANGGSGSGSGGAAGANGVTSSKLVQLNGTVGGQSPDGTNVTLKPTSLVDESAVGGQVVSPSTSAFAEPGMIPAAALVVPPPTGVSAAQQATTKADGGWSFNVKVPGYYLLQFSKNGYQTQRFVIDSSAADSTQPLKVTLLPGQGQLDGTVTGPSGRVGDAQVTITDGTNTVTTRTDSKGDVGHWSVTGLSTPSNYLVTVSEDGLNTTSAVVDMAAGDSTTLNLSLKQGVTTLLGQVEVRDVASSSVAPIGDAQVTISNGTTTHTTSTITAGSGGGSSPVGDYRLPGLTPGTYTLTITAPGYQTQIRQVTIRAGQPTLPVNAVLQSSTGIISGTVQGPVLDHDGNVVMSGGKATLQVEVNAGLTLTSSTNIYKITTKDDGSYEVDGVAPGTYVVSAQFSGMQPAFRTVTVTAGGQEPANFILGKAQVADDASISGFVGDAVNPSNTIDCGTTSTAVGSCVISFKLVNQAGDTVPTDGGPIDLSAKHFGATNYTLTPGKDAKGNQTSFPPGLYRLTISANTHYLAATVSVQVPQQGVAQAPALNLTPYNTASGVVNSVGDLTTDPNTTTTYTNCVVAIPLNQPQSPLPACDGPPPDTTKCTGEGQPTETLAKINGPADPGTTGAWTMPQLCDGTYDFYVEVTNPDYNDTVPVQQAALSRGQPFPYSPSVTRKAHLVVKFTQADPNSGLPTPITSGPSVALDCSGTAGSFSKTLNLPPNGQVEIGELGDGTISCTADGTDSTDTVTVSHDQTTTAPLTLTQPVGGFIGRVTTSWTGSAVGVDRADVAVAGATSVVNGQPISPTPTPDIHTGPDGCFAILGSVSDAIPAPPAGSPCSTTPCPAGVTAGCTPTLVLRLITTTATFTVTSSGTTTVVSTKTKLMKGEYLTFDLVQAPRSISGTLAVDAGTPDWSKATVQVVDSPPGAGSVHVTPTPLTARSTSVTWTDSTASTSNEALPGKYTLRVTLPGYAATTADVNCSQGSPPSAPTGACPDFTITLKQLEPLTVVTKDSSTLAAVNDAAVTLTANGVQVGVLTPNAGTNSVTFPGLDPDATYSAHVQAAGYQFADISGATGCSGSPLTVAATTGSTCTVLLTQLPQISGDVRGDLGTGDPTDPQNLLPNAVVTATFCNADTTISTGATACATPKPVDPADANPFIVTTDPNGHFVITGTGTHEGVHTGWWELDTTATGYHTDKTGSVTKVSTYALVTTDTVQNITLYADPVHFTLRVNDSSGNPVTSALTVTAKNLGNAAAGTLTATAPNAAACTKALGDSTDATKSACFWDFGSIVPGSYAVHADNNATTGTVNIDTTVTLLVAVPSQALTVQANITTGSIQGSVTAIQGAASAATGLGGVTLQIGTGSGAGFVVSKDPNGNSLQATTSTGGAGTPAGFFAISGIRVSGTSYVLHVSATPTGYIAPPDQSVSITSPNQVLPVALQLDRVTHTVKVEIDTTDSHDSVSGAEVDLLSPTNANQPQANFHLDPTGIVSIPEVPFGAGADAYTLQLQLHGNQLGSLTPSAGANPFNCTPALPFTPTNTSRTCKATLDVPATAGTASDVSVKYTLSEYEIGLAAKTTALSTDARTVPSYALTVLDAATRARIYSIPDIATDGTATDIFVPDGTVSPAVPCSTAATTTHPCYLVTAAPTSTVDGWPVGTEKLDPSSPLSSVIALNQAGATVTVTVHKHDGTALADGTADIGWTSPSADITAPTTPAATGKVGDPDVGTATFDNVPFATGWQVTATLNGAAAPAPTASATVDLTATASSCTTSGGSTTCAVTLTLSA